MNPQPLKHPENVSVTLTLPEVDVVLQSMGQRPYDLVADLIASIRAQVMNQITAVNTPPLENREVAPGEGLMPAPVDDVAP